MPAPAAPVEPKAALLGHDLQLIQRMLAGPGEPTPEALITAARLLIRYGHHPDGTLHVANLRRLLAWWNLTPDELNARCRDLWQQGWRPLTQEQQDGVGSGADVES